MRILKWLAAVLIILIVVYFLGPKPATPKLTIDLPQVPSEALQLENFIKNKEALHKLKPDNEARIIWADDSLKEKTEYAVVYIHGFSASQEEGDPVHENFAKKFGCNLFLARLADHGIDTVNALINFTGDRLWETAKQAYVIGRQIGKKIILMSTSTGGTLSLKLAATYPEIAGLILLSPNIAINDGNAWLLNNPWGTQIAKLVKGSSFIHALDTTALYKKYWYPEYRIESVVQLEELLETTMKASLFEKITQPVLLLYYFKDEENQDPVVKVSAMKRMYAQIRTPAAMKREVAIPRAEAHVIGSYVKSKDIETVEAECEKFAIEILKISKQNN